MVIDVGSLDAADALMFGGTGHRVWTFEPSPTKHEPIRRRLAASAHAANITFFPYALSNFTGSASFAVHAVRQPKIREFLGARRGSLAFGSAGDSLQLEQDVGHTTSTQAVNLVAVRTLDSLVAPREHVLFLKIDAQGFDFRVLLGASRLLSERRVEHLLFELAPHLMPGGRSEAATSLMFMEQMGYSCLPCHDTRAPRMRRSFSIDTYLSLFRNLTYVNIVCRLRASGRALAER